VTWFGGKEAGARATAARHGKRRRAREVAAQVGAAPLTLDEHYAAAGGRVYCAVCKLPVPREQASLEHIQPLAAGGAHSAANTAVSHKACNSAKGARTAPRRKGLRRTPLWRKPRPVPEGAW